MAVYTILDKINLEVDLEEFEEQTIRLWQSVAHKYRSYGCYYGGGWSAKPDYEGEKRCLENGKDREKVIKAFSEGNYEALTHERSIQDIMRKTDNLETYDFVSAEEAICESEKVIEKYSAREKRLKATDERILQIKSLGGEPTDGMLRNWEDNYIYPEGYERVALCLETILYAKR